MIQLNKISFLLLLFLLPMAVKAQYLSPINMSSEMSVTGPKPEKSGRDTVDQVSDSNRFWINAGLGVGTSEFSGFANISYQSGANLLSMRGALSAEMLGEEFWDIGVLYGRATSQQRYHASISAGLAIVGGKREWEFLTSGNGNDVPLTVGLPLKAQLNWQPTSVLGLGLHSFANINSEHSFAGLALSLQLGKLR